MTGDHDASVISVVMPMYNRIDTAMDAAASVLGQTHRALELIVVDDASTDGGAELVRTIDDSRIRVVRLSTRTGPGGARNAGLREAQGDLVAFQDSDDRWHPRKIEIQLQAMNHCREMGHTVAAVGCAHHRLVDTSQADWPIESADVVLHERDAVLSGCCTGGGTPKLVIDRSAVRTNVMFDDRFPSFEERDFLYRFLEPTSVFAVVDAPLILVRRGRSDHQANARRALAGYELMIDKHADDLATRDRVRAWYQYMAVREALAAGDRIRARKLAKNVGAAKSLRFRSEYRLGWLFGARGLGVAQRAGLRLDFNDRCRKESRVPATPAGGPSPSRST